MKPSNVFLTTVATSVLLITLFAIGCTKTSRTTSTSSTSSPNTYKTLDYTLTRDPIQSSIPLTLPTELKANPSPEFIPESKPFSEAKLTQNGLPLAQELPHHVNVFAPQEKN